MDGRLGRTLVVDRRESGIVHRILQGIVRPVLVARLVIGGGIRRPGRGLHLGELSRGRVAPDGTERLTLGALNLRRVGAPAALQVEVLSDCVVKKTHSAKATRR